MQNKNKGKSKAIKKQKNNKRSNMLKKFSKNGKVLYYDRACQKERGEYWAKTKDSS